MNGSVRARTPKICQPVSVWAVELYDTLLGRELERMH